jgi:outer membrane protein TolC
MVATHLSEAARSTPKSRDTSREKVPPPDLRPAEELFLQLLLVQARVAAAHQSVDRLAGWRKSIESRFQTQNAPELDVDTIRFAEARMSAESARIEAEEKRLVAQANFVMGRSAASPVVALLPVAPDDPADGAEKRQKDILAQGEELISKLYKSYQFGGIPLIALLWNEQELYKTEIGYRSDVARDAVRPETGPAVP